MIIHFVGVGGHDDFVAAIAERFAGERDVKWSTGAVEDLYPTAASRSGVAFVSPSNCMLFMDGGIDRVYSEVMFPGVREALKRCLTRVHPTLSTASGRPYLPIASALLVPVLLPPPASGRHPECTGGRRRAFLVSAPLAHNGREPCAQHPGQRDGSILENG